MNNIVEIIYGNSLNHTMHPQEESLFLLPDGSVLTEAS